jgi:hypothetical protein
MLIWTRTRKSRHPLADAEDARKLLAQLSSVDSLAALQRLCELLDGLKIAGGIDSARLYEIVDAVDRAGRPHYRSAAQEFLNHRHRLTRYQEDRIWITAGEFLTQLAEGYQWWLAQFLSGKRGPADGHAHFVRAIGRAIRLQAAALKWDYLRYTSHFGKWAELYRLHYLAEVRGRAHEKLLLYRGGRVSTPESEFMQALLLAAAAPSALLPEQIDAAERTVAALGEHLSLSNYERAKQPYFFDPASGTPPMRELPGIRPPLTARRFGAGRAEKELRDLLRRAQKRTLQRDDLGLQSLSDEMLEATLQHLLRYWCELPPDRRHVRQRRANGVAVVHGFDQVASHVGNMLTQPASTGNQESWIVENAADGGVGAVVKRPRGAWVKVGTLLAYRYAEAAIWNAGIVRHLNEDDDQTLGVGVQLVAQGGVAISVRSIESRADIPDSGALCVWLASAGCKANEMQLLMPASLYSPASAMEAALYDRRYVLSPVDLLAQGPDYEIALFQLRETDGPA